MRFLAAQPGTAHPISDSYGVSLIPATLAAAMTDASAAHELLRSATIWLCDAYERDRLGLAAVEATPIEEVERLLGGPLEWVGYERRRESLIATVLLDLAAVLGFGELYADTWNDVEAVGIYPRALRLADGPDQFDRAEMDNRLDPNVDFAESLDELYRSHLTMPTLPAESCVRQVRPGICWRCRAPFGTATSYRTFEAMAS